VANFTASRVSTERVRKLRFFQARQYISIDYGRQDVLVFSVADESGRSHPNVAKSATLRVGHPLHIHEIRSSRRYVVYICTGETALLAGCNKNLSERIAKEPEA